MRYIIYTIEAFKHLTLFSSGNAFKKKQCVELAFHFNRKFTTFMRNSSSAIKSIPKADDYDDENRDYSQRWMNNFYSQIIQHAGSLLAKIHRE